MKGNVTSVILIFGLCLLLLGCGGGGTEGGGATYDTVTLSAESLTTSLDSDVATHTYASTDTDFFCTTSDALTVSSDEIDVEITSTEVPNLPSAYTFSDVFISRATIKFTPADSGSPALSDVNLILSTTVTPGETVTIPIRVVSQEMKGSQPLSLLACTSTTFTYYVSIEFEGEEVNTGTSEHFTAALNISIADFVDGSTGPTE